jgi:hypothetical protein
VPWKAFVPDLETVLTEMPAERLKSVASAPPLTTATCSMSCDDGSEASVPNSGRVTFTPSKAYVLSWPLPPALGPRVPSSVYWTPGTSFTRSR